MPPLEKYPFQLEESITLTPITQITHLGEVQVEETRQVEEEILQ